MIEPHPLTMASIHAQSFQDGTYSCGCHIRGDRWWLCSYHEGYEDALDVAGVPENDNAPSPGEGRGGVGVAGER